MSTLLPGTVLQPNLDPNIQPIVLTLALLLTLALALMLALTLTRTKYWDQAGGERNMTFKAFCDFRRAKIAYNGLELGSFHLFAHPKRSSIIFGKTRFLTHFWSQNSPFSIFFWEFWNVKMGHHGLKTGQKHLFEHSKWSRKIFRKKSFGTILAPTDDARNPMHRALCAFNTTLWCLNGALKGDGKGSKVIPFIVTNHHKGVQCNPWPQNTAREGAI